MSVPAPPIAAIKPKQLELHGTSRVDNYYWLKQRENPEVIAYLEAENRYTESVLAPTAAMQETLYQEIVARIPQVDSSVPVLDEGYYYQVRYEQGKEYAIHTRRKGSIDAPEEILVDVNALAPAKGYFDVAGVKVSPTNNVVAFASDDVGRRFYTMRFRDLGTGKLLPDTIAKVTTSAQWANDGRHFFYVRQDPDTLRSYQVFRHELGTDSAKDTLIFEEKDDTFSVRLSKTTSDRFIVIASNQTMADEAILIDADRPLAATPIFEPRSRGREYTIDHLAGTFYIRTNDGASNFRLMRTSDTVTSRSNWTEVIPGSNDSFLEDFALFNDFIAVEERRGGLNRIRLLMPDKTEQSLTFDDPTYVAALGDNREPSSNVVRFEYASPTSPQSIFDYSVLTKEKILRKRQTAGAKFDSANYVSERVLAPARDGKQIPISLVYRKGFKRDGTQPLFVYSYGSYGISTEPGFNAAILSLLDRGFVYATPHIRGGQEMGRAWYEEGKLFNKKNTFTDFIDATKYLVEKKYGDPKRVYARGGSAGGLLMGAVMNLAPDLYHGIVAQVPFVDVVTTMLEPDIPLTTSEYDEWGNPNDKKYFDYMLSYSPYDQLEARRYPNLLVTTGLHDSQVQYWEPAKWVAKLRAMKKGDELILLKTDMTAGHGGASGRFRRHRDTAMIYAFLLKLAEK